MLILLTKSATFSADVFIGISHHKQLLEYPFRFPIIACLWVIIKTNYKMYLFRVSTYLTFGPLFYKLNGMQINDLPEPDKTWPESAQLAYLELSQLVILQNKQLIVQNERLAHQVQKISHLEERLKLNSRNSGRPPSSDKKRILRVERQGRDWRLWMIRSLSGAILSLIPEKC